MTARKGSGRPEAPHIPIRRGSEDSSEAWMAFVRIAFNLVGDEAARLAVAEALDLTEEAA